ncbi:MAG: response regulator [Bacteroidota bacterium]
MRSILIIDDNQLILRYLTMALSPHLTVSSADGPMEALKQISRELPDVILMDVQMPHLSGKDVSRLLRSNLGTTEIPLILMSGDSSKLADYESFGAQAALEKPIEVQRLLQLVEQLLQPLPQVNQRVTIGEDRIECKVVDRSERECCLEGKGLSQWGPDSRIRLRYDSCNRGFELEAVVQQALGNALVVSFTQAARALERRRFLRLELDLSVRYRTPGDHFRLAHMVNLSGGGMKLRNVNPGLAVGNSLELQLILDQGKTLPLTGLVQWVSSREDQHEAGIQFGTLDPQVQEQLALLIFRGAAHSVSAE